MAAPVLRKFGRIWKFIWMARVVGKSLHNLIFLYNTFKLSQTLPNSLHACTDLLTFSESSRNRWYWTHFSSLRFLACHDSFNFSRFPCKLSSTCFILVLEATQSWFTVSPFWLILFTFIHPKSFWPSSWRVSMGAFMIHFRTCWFCFSCSRKPTRLSEYSWWIKPSWISSSFVKSDIASKLNFSNA